MEHIQINLSKHKVIEIYIVIGDEDNPYY